MSSLVDIIDSMGWPRADQLDSLNYDARALADPRMRIDLETSCQHFNYAGEKLERPDISIQIGHKFRVATYAETGSVLNFANSLAHAAMINGRYQRLVETAGQSEFVEEDDRAFLQWNPRFEDDEAHRSMTEIIYAGYATTVQWLSWGFGKGVKSLSFRHAAPEYYSVYEELFQCPVSFKQEHNRLEFHAETVHKPLPTSDPDKMNRICHKLDKIMMKLDGETDMTRRVRGAVRSVIGKGPVSIVGVAKEMGMSERSLRRYLSAEGVNFRDIVDDIRKGMFDTLNTRGETLTSIAFLLGYNDQSAFTRAFRRWYGISPSAYRSQNIPL